MITNDNKYIKTDIDGLVKDPSSGAVLNVDNTKLSLYKKQKQNIAEQKQNMQKIIKLESDIEELKIMVGQLLQKNI